MSRLFLTVFMNTVFRVYGTETPTFLRFDSLSWGDEEGEGCWSAFLKEKLRFTVFFVMPPVYKRCKRNSIKHDHVKNG